MTEKEKENVSLLAQHREASLFTVSGEASAFSYST